MRNLLKIIQAYALQNAINKGFALTYRSKTGSMFTIIAGLLFGLGTAFILYAAFLWFNKHYEADIAALMMSVTVFVTSALMGLVAWGITRYRRYKIKRISTQIIEEIKEKLDSLDDHLDIAKEHPKTAAVSAFTAGYLAGDIVS